MPNPSLVLNLLPAPLGPWSFHVRADETIKGVPVDLGFQVFNRTTYGHFEQFLETLVSFFTPAPIRSFSPISICIPVARQSTHKHKTNTGSVFRTRDSLVCTCSSSPAPLTFKICANRVWTRRSLT